MIRFFYKSLLHPLASFLLHALKPFLNEKTQTMIRDKDAPVFQFAANEVQTSIQALRPFWIHAASGEIEYARPILRQLKTRFPDVPVLITYSSPSAKKILQQLPGVSAWGPLPWDTEKDCEAFLKRWSPRACLIARTDVWPVMAETNRRLGVPTLLFSATFAENSSRLRGLSARVTRWALNQLSAIHCVSKEDVQELQRLSLEVPVSIEGDTRFAQVLYRLEHPKPLKDFLRPSKEDLKKVLVAGSTWPEDEAVLARAFSALKAHLRMILVPHEVDEAHLEQVERLLLSAGHSFTRYSQASQWSKEDVLIVDQVGLLAELYTWGDIAFVGGSFKKQVHSVMEPLAAGLPVFVGPFHRNNREALQFKTKLLAGTAAVQEIQDQEDLEQKLNTWIQAQDPSFSSALRQEILKLSHSGQKVIEWCENLNLRR